MHGSCWDVILMWLVGSFAWGGEYAVAKSVVMGHGGWVCLSVPVILSVPSKNEEQDWSRDRTPEAIWSGILCLFLEVVGFFNWKKSTSDGYYSKVSIEIMLAFYF